ncbi:MAG: hypothetical protein K6E29_03205 [Cyanobacteria bacterium RUI128]|nr:hypothetical protein [Cyanobacteria bacterium RUI128]
MWNIKTVLYLVFVLILSLAVVVFRPQMHKQAMITNSEYEFVEMSEPTVPATVSTNNIGTQEVKFSGTNNTPQYNNPPQRVTTPARPQPVQRVQQPVQKTQQPVQKPVQQAQPKPQAQPKQETASVPQPKTVQVKPQNLETREPKHILTEQEEIIAWNKWRSNLQNQVMMDSKVYAPIGTAFKFSFTVDKYGNMSNVKVWSLNPAYSSYAVKVIKPVLMSYRNKPILNFPEGTKRIIVNVDGGFVISTTSRYSSPSDYHDYEHVKH